MKKNMTALYGHCARLLLVAAAVLALGLLSGVPQTRAQNANNPTCLVCVCPPTYANETARQVSDEHNLTRLFFGFVYPIPNGIGEMGEHQRFLIDYLFLGQENIGGILPAWMLMSQQLTAVMMQQMQIVATFFDAKHQLESQQIFRTMVARSHKTYQPSHDMCVIGTNARSLYNAERRGRLTAFILGQRSLQRQLGSAYVNAADGPAQDQKGRLIQFISHFCDARDNNFVVNNARPDVGLQLICPMAQQENRIFTLQTDIDYTRTVELPRTIAINLHPEGGDGPVEDERAIFELASNLYGHKTFHRLTDKDFQYRANHEEYQDMRAVIAKRSVVQNSFNNIVGMKAQGSGAPYPAQPGAGSSTDTYRYMEHFLRELGVLDEREIENMLGDHAPNLATAGVVAQRPSYMAMMEVLAKRLYQDPNFFTNLYDTPANVKRKSAALQAIGLMVDRDIYDSYIRNEMLMSQLLELRLVRAQRDAETTNKLMAPIEER